MAFSVPRRGFLVGRIDGALFDRLAKGGGTKYQTGWSGAVQRATFQAALKVQELAAANLSDTIQRPSTETGRLMRTVQSPQNRYSSSTGFGVGLVEFMDREARYWRMVEQGTAVAAPNYAREVRGFFRTPGRPFAAPGIGSPVFPSAGRTEDRFIESDGPERVRFKKTGRKASGVPGTELQERELVFARYTIEIHDFPAHDFYRNAWEEMFRGGYLRDILADELSQVPAPITGEPMDWRAILDRAGIH